MKNESEGINKKLKDLANHNVKFSKKKQNLA